MTISIEPEVATQVADTLDDLSTTMSSQQVTAPSGFDWSQDACADALRVVTETVTQLANIVGNLAANTADSAAGFRKMDEAAQAAMQAARLRLPTMVR